MACILALNGMVGPLAFAQSKDTLRILAFGDSLTAGYRLPKEQAFAAVLQESLRSQGYAVEVHNAGVSGDTARQGKARIAWALKRGGPFDLVLLGLGANDGLRNNPVAQMKQSLAECIEAFQKAGVKVYLLGMQLPLNFSEAYRRDFESAYRELSKKYSVALYPFLLEGVALNKNFNLQDLIHPNREGHEVIAKNLEAWLLKDSWFVKALKKSNPPKGKLPNEKT